MQYKVQKVRSLCAQKIYFEFSKICLTQNWFMHGTLTGLHDSWVRSCTHRRYIYQLVGGTEIAYIAENQEESPVSLCRLYPRARRDSENWPSCTPFRVFLHAYGFYKSTHFQYADGTCALSASCATLSPVSFIGALEQKVNSKLLYTLAFHSLIDFS